MSAFAHQVNYSCCDDFRSFRLTDDLEVVAGFLQSPGARGASRWPDVPLSSGRAIRGRFRPPTVRGTRSPRLSAPSGAAPRSSASR